MMQIADQNDWIMTTSILKRMKKATKDAPKGVLRDIGLKNQHSYTIIDVREVQLDNGEIERLLFLRNPTGNFYMKDHEVWKGDWSRLSDKWTDHVRDQLDYWIDEGDIKKAETK